MAFRMNRIYSSLIQLPESPRALPVLLGFAALLMGALFIVRLNADLNYDGEIYIAAAMKFSDGFFREGMALYPMPFYPLLISFFYKVVPNWILAGRLISLLSMALAVIPLYLLARDLFSSRAAFWCSVTYMLLPETLNQSNTVMREPIYFLCFLSATYFAQRALQTQRISPLIFSALFGALSTLFRVEGLIFFPVCFCVFAGQAISNLRKSKPHLRLLTSWVAISAVLATASAIMVSIYPSEGINRYGDWRYYFFGFIDGNLLESYYKIYDHITQIKEVSPVQGIGHHIAETMRTMMPLVYFLGLIQVLSFVIMVPNLIPLSIGLIRTVNSPQHILTLANAIGLLALAYGFFIRTEIIMKRYVMITGLLLTPWIGFGIDIILGRLSRISFGRWAVGCIVLLIFVIPADGFFKFFKNPDDLASRAGEWVATNSEFNNTKIVMNDQIVKFHTDLLHNSTHEKSTLLYLDINDDDFCKLQQFAVDNDAKVIVIQGRNNVTDGFKCLSNYSEIKEFKSKKKFIKIFKIE
jgi:hypothetical protein